MSGALSSKQYAKVATKKWPAMLAGMCAGQHVHHNQQREFVGVVSQIHRISAADAKANGAGTKAFELISVKWNTETYTVPASIHVNRLKGYRVSDLITVAELAERS